MELVVALMLLIVGSAYFLRGPGSARASHSSAPAGKRSLSRYARLVRGIPYVGPPAKPALVPLLSTGSVEVVGESYYQPALRAAARGRSGWEAPPVAAVLVPEPRNPHDEHAVRVDVNGRTVGYLPRGIAPPYQRELLKLDGRGVAGSCPARVTGGGEGYFYGICLDLAPAETCVPMNLPEGLHLLEARASVTVTGEEKHLDVLTPLSAGTERGPARPLFAELVLSRVDRGKYAGENTIAVLIDRQRVGELTRASAYKYLPLVQQHLNAGRRPGCQAVLTTDHRGPQLKLRLPYLQ